MNARSRLLRAISPRVGAALGEITKSASGPIVRDLPPGRPVEVSPGWAIWWDPRTATDGSDAWMPALFLSRDDGGMDCMIPSTEMTLKDGRFIHIASAFVADRTLENLRSSCSVFRDAGFSEEDIVAQVALALAEEVMRS